MLLPSGLLTVTVADPALVISLAGTDAVRLVVLTKAVVNGVEPQFTTAPLTNFVPVTVSVNCEPPLVAEDGLRELSVGGALTVNVTGVDAAPLGFVT